MFLTFFTLRLIGFPCATVSVLGQQSTFVALFCILHLYLPEIHISCVVTEHSARLIEENAKQMELHFASSYFIGHLLHQYAMQCKYHMYVVYFSQQILRNATHQYTNCVILKKFPN